MSRPPRLERLELIMSRLRAPDGCPWDREQSLETLRHYLLEETYEVLDAMSDDDPAHHCEELGDLLLQIAFQTQIRREQGGFVLADVVDSICDKMERRHPHVFGDEAAHDAEAVSKRWEEIKAQEGKGGLSDISRALPALMVAEKVGEKAAKVGFDWQNVEGPLAKVEEELEELRQTIKSGDKDAAVSELGDLLFASVNVARHLNIRPELALRGTIDRFTTRFAHIESRLLEQGRQVSDATPNELNTLWEEAKAE
jgi:tetrapyrrole methylase family protein/MazG family protein